MTKMIDEYGNFREAWPLLDNIQPHIRYMMKVLCDRQDLADARILWVALRMAVASDENEYMLSRQTRESKARRDAAKERMIARKDREVT